MKLNLPWISVLLLAGGVGASGCDTRHRAVDTSKPTSASQSVTAPAGVITPIPKDLPVIATYSGSLPCADCAGIRVQLSLLGKRGVSAYRLHEIYLGTPDGDKTVDSEGKAATVSGYEANPNATVYALNAGDAEHALYFLRVDDMHVRMLNGSKQEISSRFNYTLTSE